MSKEVQEGTVPFDLGDEIADTWFRVTGELRSDSDAPAPLIVLHGGPGAVVGSSRLTEIIDDRHILAVYRKQRFYIAPRRLKSTIRCGAASSRSQREL